MTEQCVHTRAGLTEEQERLIRLIIWVIVVIVTTLPSLPYM